MLVLRSANPLGLTVGAIKAKLKIPGSTLSHHLDRLRRNELITVQRNGTSLHYAVNPATLTQVASFLSSHFNLSSIEFALSPSSNATNKRKVVAMPRKK